MQTDTEGAAVSTVEFQMPADKKECSINPGYLSGHDIADLVTELSNNAQALALKQPHTNFIQHPISNKSLKIKIENNKATCI